MENGLPIFLKKSGNPFLAVKSGSGRRVHSSKNFIWEPKPQPFEWHSSKSFSSKFLEFPGKKKLKSQEFLGKSFLEMGIYP